MPTIRNWMARATTAQQEELAKLAGTSRAYLYHLAADPGSRHHRSPNLDLAVRLEAASEKVKPTKEGLRPAPLSRFDLIPECARCPYANTRK